MKAKNSRKSSYHHGNLKSELIEAGVYLIECHGLSGVSLRKCAAHVGVSHTAPQNHFGNLAGLLSEISALGYSRLAEQMTKNLPQSPSLHQRREAAITGYVCFAEENPGLYELMFSSGRTIPGHSSLMETVRDCFQILRDVAAGVGGFSEEASIADAKSQILIWSLLHGYAQLKNAQRFKSGAMQEVNIMDIMSGINSGDR